MRINRLCLTGDWWKADTETMINQAMQTGSAPTVSDAHTINGLPGPLYNCSAKGKEQRTQNNQRAKSQFTSHSSIMSIYSSSLFIRHNENVSFGPIYKSFHSIFHMNLKFYPIVIIY